MYAHNELCNISYLLIVLKLLNVMRCDVIGCLILVHVLSHIHHIIHWVVLYIQRYVKQIIPTLVMNIL